MSPTLERILTAGNKAPSGENCQPWHFVVRGLLIEVHLLSERDQSAYGEGQRASYLACGAAIENIAIAATAEGYSCDIAYFPKNDDPWHVATIVLREDISVQKDVLADYVSARVSNRKPYAAQPLSLSEKEALLRAADDAGYGHLKLVEDREQLRALGRVGSTNEEVMLANRSLHQFFFSHISWTKEEDDEKKMGFYIKTLELPPPAEKMFKLLSNWSVMRMLAALGFNRVVAKQNAVTNASAAAFGAIGVPATEPIDFVRVGRTVERVWIAAASVGLSFQPLTGVLFFKLKSDAQVAGVFTRAQEKLIESAYARVASIFAMPEGHIAFMFRVGHGEDPSAQAVRFPLSEVVEVVS